MKTKTNSREISKDKNPKASVGLKKITSNTKKTTATAANRKTSTSPTRISSTSATRPTHSSLKKSNDSSLTSTRSSLSPKKSSVSSSQTKTSSSSPKKSTDKTLTSTKIVAATAKGEAPKVTQKGNNASNQINERSNSSPLLNIKEEPIKDSEKAEDDTQADLPKAQQTASATNASSQPMSPIISETRYAELVKKADRAIREGKTFAFRHHYNIIRNAFLKRGWIELAVSHLKQKPSGKRTYTHEKLLSRLPKKNASESHSNYIKRCEYFALSCLIEHAPVGLLWTFRRNNFDHTCHRISPSIIVNKLINVPFVTKGGILRQFRNLNWIWEDGVAEVYFPRSYIASSAKELNEFTENFRSTASISFLKFVQEKCKRSGWPSVFHAEGEIPFKTFEFALRHCYQILNSFHNNDIDLEFPNLSNQQDWNDLFSHHNLLTTREAKIQHGDREISPILKNITILLGSIKTFWPQYELDGHHNLWIIKPSLQNCGRGLIIMNSYNKILNHVSKPNRHDIIQKYVETPLLIHNTKFDIRQWFVVTSVKPLTIWMYKENYLRFSSQMFDLSSLHESVHFTNHCIQRKYPVNVKRDGRLPKTNMWDNHTFQAYLRQMGNPEIYYQRVYPGIKRAIIATLLASQSNMSKTTNAFELFGADFVISEDFTPWLLEINSCPDLARTTTVTARMVPRLIEDLLKVVIDRKSNPKCSVGNFELIYQQKWPSVSRTSSGSKLEIKVKEISSKDGKIEPMEEQFLDEMPKFQVKGKSLPPIDAIRREMYQHLLHGKTDPRQQRGTRLDYSTNSTKSFATLAEKASQVEDKLNTLLHFNDTSTATNKMSTAEKLKEISKTLQRINVKKTS